MEITKRFWDNANPVPSKSYVCGFCGERIASANGYKASLERKSLPGSIVADSEYIYVCHHCQRPTYLSYEGGQYPGAPFGRRVEHLPEDVKALYFEARAACSVSAFTASVLCSRKLLMNVAVSKGAKPNGTFADYVDWLETSGYLPPEGKIWVDKIRAKGNEATHEIPSMKREDAELLITFLEMLLRFVFEFPAIAAKQ